MPPSMHRSQLVLAEAAHRERIGEAIAESYRRHPPTSDEDELAMASAMAMTEAEPWDLRASPG